MVPLKSPVKSNRNVHGATGVRVVVRGTRIPIIISTNVNAPDRTTATVRVKTSTLLVGATVTRTTGPMTVNQTVNLTALTKQVTCRTNHVPVHRITDTDSPLAKQVGRSWLEDRSQRAVQSSRIPLAFRDRAPRNQELHRRAALASGTAADLPSVLLARARETSDRDPRYPGSTPGGFKLTTLRTKPLHRRYSRWLYDHYDRLPQQRTPRQPNHNCSSGRCSPNRCCNLYDEGREPWDRACGMTPPPGQPWFRVTVNHREPQS